MRIGRAAALALMLVASTCDPTWGLDPGRALSQYQRRSWDIERGYASGAVQGIGQGRSGYLWLATENGLVRFDGFEFRPAPRTDRGQKPQGPILALIGDGEGALWASQPIPTLLRILDERVDTVAVDVDPTEAAVTALGRGADGSLLVNGMHTGVLRWRNGALVRASPSRTTPPGLVISLAETTDGTIWMGTRDAGLFRLRGNELEAIQGDLPDRKVNCLVAVGQELWIGTDRGVLRWDGRSLTVRGAPDSLASVQALTMLVDRDGTLWIGSGAGLLRVEPHGASPLVGGPLEGSAVTALFEDREGNLWAGGSRGVEQLSDTPLTTFGRSQGLPSDASGPIYVDARERTWFGPAEGGLAWLRGSEYESIDLDGLSADIVYSLAGDERGVWIGRRSGRLSHLELADGDRPRITTFEEADGLARSGVYSVAVARDGAVWAGTLSGGVSRRGHEGFLTLTTANGLTSNTVNSLAEARDGSMWLATPSGLNAVRLVRMSSVQAESVTVERVTVEQGLPSAEVDTLLVDSSGILWTGTSRGLAAFATGPAIELVWSARWSEGANPLAAILREPVVGLAEDGQGRLWLATTSHVASIDRERLLSGQLVADEDWRLYGPADGLWSSSGVRRHRSMVTAPSGRVWLSMARGLSVSEGTRRHEPEPTLVHITELAVDETAIEQGEGRLPSSPQRIAVSFVGVSLAAPERVRYRYRLDGFDEDWTESAAREAVYTNLRPGSYRFRVSASNREGLWNGDEAGLAFVIPPAVWQTGWARAIAVVLLLVLSWIGLRWRLRLENRRLALLFEERLDERARISQELHDTLLQGFLSASMQLHVVVKEMSDDLAPKQRLGGILRLMQRVLDEGRNALHGVRSATPPDGADLDVALARVPHDLAVPDSPDVHIVVEGSTRPLRPDVRDEIYRIGREALANALRHSDAGRIEIALLYGRSRLGLRISDDGRGIESAVLQSGRDGHWGLSGMRERAERIGAQLRLFSAPGAGTEIELIVPAERVYPASSRAHHKPWLRWLGSRSTTTDTDA